MTATPEQINALGGEIKKPEPELKYPEWMSTDYNRPRRHIKRRKRIKSRIMTGAWAVATIGMGIALIVWPVKRRYKWAISTPKPKTSLIHLPMQASQCQ